MLLGNGGSGSASGEDDGEEFVVPEQDLDRISVMASTAALCVFDKIDEYTGVDVTGKVVCSLHADGSVRMWVCGLNSGRSNGGAGRFTYPRQMKVLDGVVDASMDMDGSSGLGSGLGSGNSAMPLPHLWSSSNDSLYIQGHCYMDNTATGTNHHHRPSSSTSSSGGGSGGVEFVVAVGIRIAENVGMDRTSSPFHLTTLTGDFTSSSLSSASSSSEMVRKTPLVVPKEVDSMKAMEFVPMEDRHTNHQAWELRALYSSVPEGPWGGSPGSVSGSASASTARLYPSSFSHSPARNTMLASYSSNSSQPHLYKSSSTRGSNSHTTATLESFVQIERERILHECELMVQTSLEDKSIVSGGNSKDDQEEEEKLTAAALHQINGWYMQRIFRSGSVQTVGMDKATDGTVRRALRQIVPALCIDEDHFDRDMRGKSIEVETLVVMNKWAKFDETRSSSSGGNDGSRRRMRAANQASTSTSAGTGAKNMTQPSTSVYSEFFNASAQRSETPEIREDSDEDMMMMTDGRGADISITYRERKIQQNHNRWKKLLLAVNYQEMKLLSPVGFAVLQPSTSNLVLRPGITSTMMLQEATPGAGGSSKTDKLDSIMLSMLERIENFTSNSNSDASSFSYSSNNTSNRKILSWLECRVWQAVSKAKLLQMDHTNALINHLTAAIANIDVDGWTGLYSKLLIILNAMTQEEVIAWLSKPLPSSFLSDSTRTTGAKSTIGSSAATATSLIIPNASRLSRQYLGECQRLALARYICINGTTSNGMNLFNTEQERVSFLSYLHTVATSWACAQMLTPASTSQYEGVLKVSPPLFAKRLRTSAEGPKQISLLSAHLSRILKSYSPSHGSSSVIASVMSVSASFVRSAFEASEGIYPELAIIPQDFPQDAARISLRLLAPLVAFPGNYTNSIDRSTKAADCLLSEVHALCKTNSTSLQQATEALEHASVLLNSSTHSVMSDPDSMAIFLKALGNPPDVLSAKRTEATDIHDMAIIETIQHIFDASSAVVNSSDVLILAKMENMRKLLLPWVAIANENQQNAMQLITDVLHQNTADPVSVLSHAASVMIEVSKLVERVQVLDKHSAMLRSSALRGPFANVLISAINDLIETVQHHAHSEDYIGIVEYPALWSALFRNALQGHCWEDAFEACLSNPIKERKITNFKRLVIAMADTGAFGVLLDKMIFFIVNGYDSNSDMDFYELAAETLVEASQRSSIENIVASSSATVDYRGCLYALHAAYGNWRRSCQAIDFLGALALRHIPVPDDDDLDSISSTQLDVEVKDGIMDELVLSAVSSAQLIQLVDNPHLRYIVSGELSASPPPIEVDLGQDGRTHWQSSSSLAMEVDDEGNSASINRSSRLYSDKDLLLRAKRLIAIQALQRDACAPENLLEILNASDTSIIDALPRLGYYDHAIALSYCKKENKKGAKPRGRDVFVDAMSHMLCKSLAPVALALSRSVADDIDESNGQDMKSRPTMHQLRLLSGKGQLSCCWDSWKKEETAAAAARGATALELLRLYTESYAAEDNKIALDVAETLLDLDDCKAALPSWLKDLIIGSGASGNDGLFAKNGGNPAALLNLYIKSGLYIEACDLVIIILLGDECERQNAATSRLPERGNIDFVPYETIDNLWNLIETCLESTLSSIQMGKLLKSRDAMESALERHFKLMQVSEQGMLSARALSSR